MNTEKELNYRLYIQKEESFTRSNIKSEFSRYNDIKYGNVKKVRENVEIIKKTFFEGKGSLSDDPLRNTMYHFVVSAGIIARVCIDAGLPHDDSYTLSDIYIRKADKCKSPTEIVDLLCEMQLDFATRMKRLKKKNAISIHVRNAIDYIYDHLHEPITLQELAEREGLNPNYFSKLFAKETGSTAKAYILNAKITTAKNMLLYSGQSLSNISLSLGFSSQSAFTAAFKAGTGMTPGQFRNTGNYTELI
ncbi:MAG: helix-turn-helix transcriptional regulator [Lachnospiraceae bacterium]|nr:helix-turn-helix transcriptional regulator [Lachnospiraceae bacterium]